MKYEFGVGTQKWELEADDMYTAYISMSIFIAKDIPVAVYSPQSYAFIPSDILKANQENFNPKKVNECLKTIKSVNDDKQ